MAALSSSQPTTQALMIHQIIIARHAAAPAAAMRAASAAAGRLRRSAGLLGQRATGLIHIQFVRFFVRRCGVYVLAEIRCDAPRFRRR
jgi:hypothetical protein